MFPECRYVHWERKACQLTVLLAILSLVFENGATIQFQDQCSSPLGMENFEIPSESLRASRSTTYWEPYKGRINDSVSGWCAGLISDKEWFEIKFDTDHYVTAVANQATARGWVLEFTLAYSRGLGWFDYMENGTIKIFRNYNSDYSSEIVVRNLSFPVRAKTFRIYPKRAVRDTCLRLELYGCQACFDPFGIEVGIIPDKAMTSSSFRGPGFEPFRGRLNDISGNGSWCADGRDVEPYLQIDLGNRFQISMIAIQGNEIHEFVTILKTQVNCSSLANETSALNSSQAGNITLGNNIRGQNSSVKAQNAILANNTMEQNSSVEAQNVTLASNSSGKVLLPNNTTGQNSSIEAQNITLAKNTFGQNSSVEAQNVTMDNNTGTIAEKATVKKCGLETKTRLLKAYVKEFIIEYSDNGDLWRQYHEGGYLKEFEGNTDPSTTELRRISNQLIARYIRIRSKPWKRANCLRVEIYGCKECSNDLGAGTGEIPNKAMTASSHLGLGFQPWLARLNNPDGAWCSAANNAFQYLQVQFPQIRKIRQLRTQGSVTQKGWVSSYFIEHSQNGEKWKNYTTLGNLEIFDGNFNEHEVVTRAFLFPFVAKFVRIWPVAWEKAICLRIELYGCPACQDPLGMESHELSDDEITASYWRTEYNPYRARLNNYGGWVVYSDFSMAHFIQVKLGSGDFTLTGVATQGIYGYLVKTYTLSYSMDGIDWFEYRENGQVKIFEGNNPSTETVQHELEKEIIPAYVRLNVKNSTYGHVGLRMELYGCKRFDVSVENDALRRPTYQSGNLTLSANSRLAVDGNRASNYSLGSCSFTGDTEVAWWLVDLRLTKTVTGVFITNRGDENYRNVTELSIRVGFTTVNGGIGNPTCGGLSHVFHRGAARMVPCVPEIKGRFVTIFVLEVNSSLSLCEVEVEVSDIVSYEGLGMYTEHIPDERITASSWISSKHLPYYGRLDTNIGHGAWCAAANDVNPYLEIDLEMEHSISGIIIQGKYRLSSDQLGDAWVTVFSLSYAVTREQWTYVTDVKTKQPIEFLGNDATTLRKKITLSDFPARLLRFYPKEWKNLPCLRIEIIGSKVCASPNLGVSVSPQKVSNSAMMHSTCYSTTQGYKARLNYYTYGWIPTYGDQLAVLKIDFGAAQKRITAIALQSGSGFFVSGYEISYSVDGWSWRYWIEHGREKVFSGFTIFNSINRFQLPYPVNVRYLIFRPRAFYRARYTRVEVYGCAVITNLAPVGIERSDEISSSSMTASSWKPGYYPHTARLHANVSWCAATNKQDEYLEVDLGKEFTLTKIALQGDPDDGSGVTSFAIAFSRNGGQWTDYKINGARKVFQGSTGNTVVYKAFDWKFIAKKIRIYVRGWYIWPCMRTELYHTGCINSLDFSLKKAKKGGYTASSFMGPGFDPWHASIVNSSRQHGWCADDTKTQYLQIDLGTLHHVTGVVTRGVAAGIVEEDAWVEKYRIQYSVLGDAWTDHTEQDVNKTFDGNTDAVFAKVQVTSFHARYVRVIPTQWHYGICMKMELKGCKVCSAPLGMENKNSEEIKDSQIKTAPASGSSYDSPRLRHVSGYINLYYWMPFIQVDLGPASKRLTAVAVQGRVYDHNTWSFYMKYSQDGSEWYNYTENGVTRIFEGGEYMDLIAKHYFNQSITTRFTRVLPLTWSYDANIRIELYGCPVCEHALGIERGFFNVSASTYFGPGYEPWRGRLNNDAGFWRPLQNKNYEFLQFSFDAVMAITGLSIQGDGASCGRVTRFYLHYGLDGKRFSTYVDPVHNKQLHGNEGSDTTKYVKLGKVIRARYVRVRPWNYYKQMCMSIELYGCLSSELYAHDSLGFEVGKIANHSLKASSSLNKRYKPEYGRLNTFIEGGAWCARETNAKQYFQVDLIEVHKITNIVMQGKYSGSVEIQGWVTKFSVTYSYDGIAWIQHVEEGIGVFEGNNVENKTINHKLFPSLRTRFVRVHATEWHQLICMRVELTGCKACAEPLGLENGNVNTDYLSGSSGKDRWDYIRLHADNPWYSDSPRDNRQYLQVVVTPYGRTVTALAVQSHLHMVTSFTLKTSEDGVEWYDYIVHGNIEVFSGCTAQYQTLRKPLTKNISSRYIRLHPRTWSNYGHISLELYGCDECAEPLGMVSGLIPDSSIKASSFQDGGEPWRARLGHGSGWIPSSGSSSEYLEVDLGEPNVITYIEIEGDSHYEHWLDWFFLDYKMNSDEHWKNYQLRGRSEKIQGLYMRNMVKKMATEQKLVARFIRIRVQDWHGGRSLKLELYGCDKVCSDEVGIGSWVVKETAFTASSYQSSRSYPWMARLHGTESWCPGKNDSQPFLQVDIGRPYRLRFIATQGLYRGSNYSAWVQQYTLDFRGEHWSWFPYTESGSVKIFTGNSDGTSIVKNQLTNVTNVRYIHFHPRKWHIRACVRIELYGCKVFNEQSLTPLGMSDHRIPDDDILASDSFESSMHGTYGPWLARLHGSTGCWTFRPAETFLLVDLGAGLVSVGGVATQGCNNNELDLHGYVLEYMLSFSDDGTEWYYYLEERVPKVFSGNNYKEQDLPVRHVFIRALYTRYVKFHVTRWVTPMQTLSLRVEIYGKRMVDKFLLAAKPSISASSFRYPLTPQDSILSSNKSWCAEFDDDMQYLEIDLKRNSHITEIITQGAVDKDAWVETYTVSYGHSGDIWKQYKENGSLKVFQGNNDSTSIVTGQFMRHVLARFIRIHPVSWVVHVCMRVDIRNRDISNQILSKSQGRSTPLGIQKQKINNSAMTASSHAGPSNEPWRARLDVGFQSEAWRAGEDNSQQYLQIDLETSHNITQVATQGSHVTNGSCWVTRYNLSYSLDGSSWESYMENEAVKVFLGNSDDHGIVKHRVSYEIKARYVRFLPVTWFNHVCMKVELYGYQVCGFPLGVNNGELLNDSFTASSYNINNEPWSARLNRVIGGGGWCATNNITGEYLLIDLGEKKRVTGISTQGKHGKDAKWVTEYTVSSAIGLNNLQPYMVDGKIKVFKGNVDQFTAVTHHLDPTSVRFIKFHAKSWHEGICMRVEIFGCDVDVVNGGYTDWSAWSACTASCAGGQRYRERACKNPLNQNGGSDCSSLGADKEEKICNAHLCPALSITAPPAVATNTPVIMQVDNCTGSAMRLDFGDCNVTNTSLCVIEHTYNTTGLLELVLQPQNHSLTRRLILIQDPVTGFKVNESIKAIALGGTYFIKWAIDTGTAVRISIDYGDNSTQTYLLSRVRGTLQGNNSHTYSAPGVFHVIIMAMNELNNVSAFQSVVVEIPINISCLEVKSCGPFELIYQQDEIKVALEIRNGSNPEILFITGEGTNFTQRSTELFFKYQESGEKNIIVFVYNNISTVQVRKTVYVHKVLSLGKVALDVLPANFTEPTQMTLNVTEGFPYSCFWDLGDGSFIQTSSFQNTSSATVYHMYKAIDIFNVVANCSNNFGYSIQTAVAAVQLPIKDISLSHNCPTPIDESVILNISTEHRGTNSCFIISLGDGTVFGFGHADCAYEKPSVEFTNLVENNFSLEHDYASLGSYDVSLQAWNLVSRFEMHVNALVVKIPCNFPTISVPEFEKDINSRTTFTPSQIVYFHSQIEIDCRATSHKDITWSIAQVSLSGDELGNHTDLNPVNKHLEKLTIQDNTVTYGIYVIRLNVSMRGQYEVFSVVEGYIEIRGNPLIASIKGGSLTDRAFGKPYTFDGSDSRDPDDTEDADETGHALHYYWLCQNASWDIQTDLVSTKASLSSASTYNASTFCNGSRRGVLMEAGSSIEIPYTGNLKLHSSYAVVLFVSKTVNSHFRISNFSQVVKIVDGDPPVIKIRCKRNCGATVNPSEGLVLESEIDTAESAALVEAQYQWHVYERDEQLEDKSVWREVIANEDTKINQLHLLENALHPGNTYKVSVVGMVPGRTNGYSELVFSVNIPPSGGSCSVDQTRGYSDETIFAFKCEGWIDKDLPLSYEFQYRNSYGVVSLLLDGIAPVFFTKLPLGDVENNFTLDFQVKIFDSHKTYSTSNVDVKVLLGKNEQNETFTKFQNFVKESLPSLIEVGKIQEATREVNALVSVLNFYALQNGSAGREERQQMRTAIGTILANKTVSSLSDVKQLGSALSQVTLVKEEVTVDIQEISLKQFQEMAVIANKRSRDRETLASHIKDTAVVIETGIVNVVMAASFTARVEPRTDDSHLSFNTTREKARSIALEAMATLSNVTDILSSLAVVGDEPLVMSVPQMSLVLQKIRSDVEGEHTVGNGQVSVHFPSVTEVLGSNTAGRNVDLQVLVFPDNPFTWDNTSVTISSHVLTVQLKDNKQNVLEVSFLQNEISLLIPRNVDSLTKPSPAFMKGENGSIAYHTFDIENVGEAKIIQIRPNNKDSLFEIHWRYGERPRVGGDHFVAVVPDFTSCKTLENGYEICEYDPYTIFIDVPLIPISGKYYMGIATYRASKHINGTQSRERRSCSDGVRVRRSCIEYKDPPPRPTTGPQYEYKLEIPEFDPERDINYTVNSFSSPCKFWDEKNETWTSKGCKAGNHTRIDRVHCLCNHLTSFGGGFVTAPNPIDFDKVFKGFQNLSDNIAVLATIVTAFAIYILLVIWLRRMDKRDKTIGIPTMITSGDIARNSYELIIQTGPWRGSGTTANVFIMLVGEDGQSSPIALADEKKVLFTRGSTNEFLLLLPENLGKLLCLKIWHDLSGIDSSWYLSYVIIRNTQAREQYIFVCDHWLALEKGDGSVSRLLQVSNSKELTSFGTLFRTKTSKEIFDGHLWISAVAKPSKSTFTRVQRLTCCMSILFSAMITNAMFYNIGNTPDNSTVSIGPLTLSLRQVIIGVQSSLIALPLNIIVLQIFRNLKPKAAVGSKYARPCSRSRNAVGASDDWSVNNVPDKKNENASGPRLPHWCIHIAYFLCFVVIMTSSTFTLFYSMAWGKEISNQWLSSMLISFFQDAFVTQPLKIFLAALIISSILKKLPSDFKESSNSLDIQPSSKGPEPQMEFDPEEAIKTPNSMFEPPDEALVEKARKYKLLEIKAFTILKENIFHLLFLSSLLVISYSTRDPDAFTQSSHLRNVFSRPTNDVKSLWVFVESDLLPFVFDNKWYNGEEDILDGFTDDKYLYVVGMPRLRQLRTKKGVCKGNYVEYFNLSCDGSYSITDEEKDFFLPGWVKTADLTFSACPIPWRYQTALALDGLPYWGSKTVYSGGGYTADLEYYMEQAKGVIRDLQTYNWIDKYTRGVFVELTVFNAPANLFSSVTYLVESTGTGGASTYVKVDTFRLYHHSGARATLVALCEFVAVVTVAIVFFFTCKKIIKKRKEFFKNSWNVADVAQIALCFSAVGLFFIRVMNTKWTVNKVQENPFVFISFHYATKWDEISTYVISSIVFIATLKFLQLLSFNRHIAVLGHTISRAAKGLLSLGMEALLTVLAFNIFGYVVFGSQVEGFADFISTCETTLAMTLGKAYFMDLSHAEPILGPLFFSSFVIAIQFYLLNMFMAVIMDTYSDVNSEIDENSPEFEMAGFLLTYLKSLFGSGSDFEAGDEVWRKSREKVRKPTKKRTVKENCQVLREQRKLLSKKIKALYKLDRDVGDSELSFVEQWNILCSSENLKRDTEFLVMMTFYLCQDSRHLFELTISDDETEASA